jgi:uncharacterized metal-binding protein
VEILWKVRLLDWLAWPYRALFEHRMAPEKGF